LIPFFVVEPEIAARETRVVNLLVPDAGLPAGSYGQFEFFCPDPACNCRRVMLEVVEEKDTDHFLAAISYGFDREGEEAGPLLDPLNPQSEYAEELLRLVQDVILSDPDYVARLERHYHLVKQAASNPKHPAYPRLQKELMNYPTAFHLPRQSLRLPSRARKPKPWHKRGRK
jgi:hypothetical protein